MKPEAPDLVPQSTANRILGKSRNFAATVINRGHVQPVEVYGEKWVSLAALRRWLGSPRTRRRRPPPDEVETGS